MDEIDLLVDQMIAEDVAHRGPRGGRVGCSVREMNQKCLHGTVWVGEET